MIEVEIRGLLTSETYKTLEAFLVANGKHTESQDREMILLYDYPGFDINPLNRKVDIRLRNTNGVCEIMVKKTASENNIGRSEVSYTITNTWQELLDLAKTFGCTKGLWMKRMKEVFTYDDVEWSLVKAISEDGTKTYYFFEAEQAVIEASDLEQTRNILVQKVSDLKLSVISPDEWKEFINMLGVEVNKEIVL